MEYIEKIMGVIDFGALLKVFDIDLDLDLGAITSIVEVVTGLFK